MFIVTKVVGDDCVVLFVHPFVCQSMEEADRVQAPLWEASRLKISSLISKIADFLRKKNPILNYSKDMSWL